jgi:hypothetical protein
MKNILFAAILMQAGSVYAQGEVKAPAAPAISSAAAPGQSAAPARGKYAADIARTIKYLSALLERDAEIPSARLETLGPEIKKFDDKVKDALGTGITGELARREKEQEDKELTSAALKTLQDLRAALQVYYGDNGGKYPADLAALAPARIPAIPELWLPGHKKTSAVKLIDSKKYDKDLAGAVTDSGGWLYFSNPGSASYGLLVLNCSHKERPS